MNNLKKVLLLLIFSFFATCAFAKTMTVGIVVPLEHKAMNEIVAGFKTALQKDYPGKIKFLVKNAGGDLNIQRSIIQSYQNNDVDLIAPIGTTATQMTAMMIQKQPIVSIASEYTQQEQTQRKIKNITGLKDEISVNKQLKFVQETIPNLKEITVVYSPDDRMFKDVAKIETYAKKANFKVQRLMIQQLADLYTLSQRIDRRSQAIFILKDHMVVSGISTLAKVANTHKIPLISSDEGSVQGGSGFALGVKEYQIGVEAAKIASEVLQGKSPGDIPVTAMKTLYVFTNPDALTAQSMPLATIQQAAKQSHYQLFNVETHRV